MSGVTERMTIVADGLEGNSCGILESCASRFLRVTCELRSLAFDVLAASSCSSWLGWLSDMLSRKAS